MIIVVVVAVTALICMQRKADTNVKKSDDKIKSGHDNRDGGNSEKQDKGYRSDNAMATKPRKRWLDDTTSLLSSEKIRAVHYMYQQ